MHMYVHANYMYLVLVDSLRVEYYTHLAQTHYSKYTLSTKEILKKTKWSHPYYKRVIKTHIWERYYKIRCKINVLHVKHLHIYQKFIKIVQECFTYKHREFYLSRPLVI